MEWCEGLRRIEFLCIIIAFLFLAQWFVAHDTVHVSGFNLASRKLTLPHPEEGCRGFM